MERSILHTPKTRNFQLNLFWKNTVYMYRNIERTWNRKTIFTVASTYVDIKKKSYTNTKIPTPINLFILVLVIHVQQSYIISCLTMHYKRSKNELWFRNIFLPSKGVQILTKLKIMTKVNAIK